jgi:hypothetical protein
VSKDPYVLATLLPDCTSSARTLTASGGGVNPRWNDCLPGNTLILDHSRQLGHNVSAHGITKGGRTADSDLSNRNLLCPSLRLQIWNETVAKSMLTTRHHSCSGGTISDSGDGDESGNNGTAIAIDGASVGLDSLIGTVVIDLCHVSLLEGSQVCTTLST